MALPPLGRLVNSFLSGLNELRRCLLPGIFPKLRKSMQAALVDIDAILQANERAVLTPGLRGDASELRHIAREMKSKMKELVTPYLEAALENALGNEEETLRYNNIVLAAMKTKSGEETTSKGAETSVRNGTAAGDSEQINAEVAEASEIEENDKEQAEVPVTEADHDEDVGAIA